MSGRDVGEEIAACELIAPRSLSELSWRFQRFVARIIRPAAFWDGAGVESVGTLFLSLIHI